MVERPLRRPGAAVAAGLAAALVVSSGCSDLTDKLTGSKKSSTPAALGEIQVRNENGQAGTAVAEVVVPLERGHLRSVPRIRTEHGGVCQARRLGAAWPDGSLRYLAVDVPVDATANHLETMALSITKDKDPGFRLHSAVAGSGGKPTKLAATFRVQGTPNRFGPLELVEDGPLVRVYRSRVRALGSMFYAELDMHVYSGLPHVRFILTWGNSDPRSQALFENPGQVWFEFIGAEVVVDEQVKVLNRVDRNGTTSILVHHGGDIGDGQSQTFEGCFLFAGENPPRLHARSKAWVTTGGFGPFGELLPGLVPDQKEFDDRAAREDKAQAADPWAEAVHGCDANPGNTGDQPDFGEVMRDVDDADTACLEPIDDGKQAVAFGIGQRRRRLVEQQDLGPV